MATLQNIKRRLRATRNMQQITRAMEAVSASKMRKSQLVALGARAYSVKALEILGNIGEMRDLDYWLFDENKDSSKIGLLVVTSDKGLCGGYNSNVLKTAWKFVREHPESEVITVGKRAIKFFERRGIKPNGDFVGFGDYVEVEATSPVARLLSDRFKSKKYREVWVVYTNFISTLKQEVALRKILPVDLEFIREIIEGIIPEYGRFSEERLKERGTPRYYEYKFEPDPLTIFETLIPSLFEVAIHHIILEANASEHSARMVAMKSASDNASEIIDELTLSYNKARQAGITKELLEVVAGKEALGV